MTFLSTLEILQKTKLVLLTDGWCQYINVNADGACCLIGAVEKVLVECNFLVIDNPYDSYAVYGLLKKHTDSEQLPVLATWNDTPGRTVEDVLALIDKAIASVEVGT